MRALPIVGLLAALLPVVPAAAQTPGQTPIPVPGVAASTPGSGRLPGPVVPEGSPPAVYLQAAKDAIAAGQDGVAMVALEQAETRLLDRSVRPSRINQPDARPEIARIVAARGALAAGDRMQALGLIDAALAAEAAAKKP